ncbi:MAG TPA: hypothetical protein VGO93_10405 [Candidatus Xenobia bacterium]|jgi:hypothetical protein
MNGISETHHHHHHHHHGLSGCTPGGAQQGLSSMLGGLMGTGCSTGGAMGFEPYQPGPFTMSSYPGVSSSLMGGAGAMLAGVEGLLSSTQSQPPLGFPAL